MEKGEIHLMIKRRKLKPGVKLFLGILPFILAYVIFCYLPLTGWSYAFYDYRPGRQLTDCEFVGLRYFTNMFENPVSRRELFRVMTNTVAMSAMGLMTSFLPMFFAIMLNEVRHRKYRKFVQTVTTIPNFISWILVFAIATAMFSVESGALNVLLKELGIIDQGLNILGTSKHAWLFMLLLGLWKGLGWSSVIYMSSLSGIDQELYEAASVDGASRFQRIRYITIPGLMPTFVTLFIMGIGNFLNMGMDQYYVFSNAFNKEKIEVLSLYTYNVGLAGNNISRGTAIGMMQSAIALVLLFASNMLSGKIREEKVF